jgi:hypothetical protein
LTPDGASIRFRAEYREQDRVFGVGKVRFMRPPLVAAVFGIVVGEVSEMTSRAALFHFVV